MEKVSVLKEEQNKFDECCLGLSREKTVVET